MNETVKIREIKNASSDGPKCVNAGSPLRSTIDFLAENKIGVALVVDAEGGLVGVVSERDVVRAIYEHGGEALDYSTESFMSKQVITCSSDDDVITVARTMSENNFRHLPIVEDGFLAGVVSSRDVMDQLSADQ